MKILYNNDNIYNIVLLFNNALYYYYYYIFNIHVNEKILNNSTIL
jgi:hypothetical protein